MHSIVSIYMYTNFYNAAYMLNIFKQALNSAVPSVGQVLKKYMENLLEQIQVMIAESIINWLFFSFYFRNDLMEVTWGPLFLSQACGILGVMKASYRAWVQNYSSLFLEGLFHIKH